MFRLLSVPGSPVWDANGVIDPDTLKGEAGGGGWNRVQRTKRGRRRTWEGETDVSVVEDWQVQHDTTEKEADMQMKMRRTSQV